MLTNETSLWSVSCHCGCDRDLIVWIIPESKPVQGFPPASMNFDHLRLDCYKTKNWDLKLSFKMRHNCCHWLVLFDRDSYIIISSHQITTNLFSCKCQKVVSFSSLYLQCFRMSPASPSHFLKGFWSFSTGKDFICSFIFIF